MMDTSIARKIINVIPPLFIGVVFCVVLISTAFILMVGDYFMNHNLTAPISYGAATGTVFLGLNVEQWGIAGVIVGILTAVFTAYIHWKRYKRK